MSRSATVELRAIEQIAEMKRVYSVIDSSLPDSVSACLVVASASPGEGKTLIAAGLASLAAQQHDQRVLCIDLNWRAPALHKHFGLNLSFGLTDLKPAQSLLEFAQPSGIEHLDILTAPKLNEGNGQVSGNKGLSATEIMTQAREAYDMVIIDTSAILPTNRSMVDPVTFSKAADGILLVVLNYVTPKQQVKRAHMILETSGARVLGVVVNQWKNPML